LHSNRSEKNIIIHKYDLLLFRVCSYDIMDRDRQLQSRHDKGKWWVQSKQPTKITKLLN
jgi:hypothetical protein